jgi:uncharacterized heparinase superfamily protein
VVELLFDLLPLRQMFASREVDTPEPLLHAIDRMLPMLRLFRHGDGTLSHFNGMGITAADQLATLLTYDDMRSQPIHHAPHSGYERLEAGKTLLVADVGRAPPTALSMEAGAGCLSFEFSSGPQRIILNCGVPRSADKAVVLAARTTSAHSTASIADVSSCRFLSRQGSWLERILASWLLRRLGPVVISGPSEVQADRGQKDHVQILEASHDGYASQFGLVHRRRWRLSVEGQWLEGEDVFSKEGKVSEDAQAVIRFHLAPGVRASRVQGGRMVMLVLPNREAWQFEVDQGQAQLEESVFFSATNGTRRTEQIILAIDPFKTASIRWRFVRLARASQAAARESERAPELL